MGTEIDVVTALEVAVIVAHCWESAAAMEEVSSAPPACPFVLPETAAGMGVVWAATALGEDDDADADADATSVEAVVGVESGACGAGPSVAISVIANAGLALPESPKMTTM